MKKQRPGHSTVMPVPRDGDVAVQEELDAARRAGTPAAYDLFLSRHGGHPLAARVVWSGRKYGVHGFGVRFVDAQAVVRERLKKHLSR